MNINLTTDCNNHCYYCFQEDLRKQHKELSLEECIQILNWGKNEINSYGRLVLLGGEPTLYSHIIELLDIIHLRFPETEILIITNMLCNTDVMKQIVEKSKIMKILFLINSTYDDNNEKLFYANLKLLENCSIVQCFSITLTENTKLNKKYIQRLRQLHNDFPFIKILRIGFFTPKPSKGIVQIHNYEKDLDYLFNTLKNSFLYSGDCAVNCCQLSLEYQNNLLSRKDISFTHLPKSCNNSILDVMPDLSGKYCSSGLDKSFIVNNVFNYKTSLELKHYLDEQEQNYQIKNKKCLNCELYKNKKCFPCHSFDQALVRGENGA